MNLLPIIVRELRAQSRQPMTYWLRVVGIGVILGVMALVDSRGAPSALGGRYFSALNAALFLSIWIFVPLLTADTISREKREGTLGLLFLTPLTPIGIVFGKSLIHTIRAITLFLAVLPALALPFLLGGLTWKDCAVALLLNGSALMLALAAGLLASTLATDSRGALALALVLSFGFAYLFMLVHLHAFYSTLPKYLNLRFTPSASFGWVLPGNLISQIQLLVIFNTGLGLWLLKDASLFAGHDYTSDNVYRRVFSIVLPLFFVSSFFLLPGIGLLFSMQRLHFIGAWLLTCATGLLLPALTWWWMKRSWFLAVISLFATQFVLALISRILLERHLTGRRFVLDSA